MLKIDSKVLNDIVLRLFSKGKVVREFEVNDKLAGKRLGNAAINLGYENVDSFNISRFK